MATEHTISPEGVVREAPIAPDDDVDIEPTPQPGEEVEPQAQEERDGKKEGTTTRTEREQGKTILPFTRVQKIMKADKDLPMIARDATFLVSLATEEFIKKLCQACQRLAERDKRTTVQQKDVASVVRRVEEFLFLEEIIGSQEPTGRRKLQKSRVDAEASGDRDQLQWTLHDFVQTTNESEDNDVITNEDGAMYAE